MTAQPDRGLFHARSAGACLEDLRSSARGLDDAEAGRRLAAHGANRLPAPAGRSLLARIGTQFNNVLIYALIASACVTALLDHWVDTAVIVAVVIVNAVIGFIQEGRAEEAMAAIRNMLAPHATVMRDGERRSIDAADLVPGDIVLVEAGDRVSADLRLLTAHGLKAEEAVLTGESVPVDKAVAPVSPDAPLGDRSSMLFSGTLVAAGAGRGLVVATGADTEVGHISGLLASVETLTTPLLRQMDLFARWLTVFILLIAASLLVWGYFLDHADFGELFMSVVGLSVAAIPEGLPAVLTITLSVGVRAMARRNAIVRRLPAIETLGAVSVICSDKTGTLTRNEMTVAALAACGHDYVIEGEGYAPKGAVLWQDAEADPREHSVLVECARATALCNDAELQNEGEDWRVEGDPMEGALLAFAGKIQADVSGWERVDAIPFDAAHRYMAVHHRQADGTARVDVKGAPEAVIALCGDERTADGGVKPLAADFWHEQVERLAARGQRVLALAVAPAPDAGEALVHDALSGRLTLVGLVGLIDPPRPEAIAAVAECHAAGIGVKMITGDHAATARAIGSMIGLTNCEGVLTGADIDTMDDAELAVSAVATDINTPGFRELTPEERADNDNVSVSLPRDRYVVSATERERPSMVRRPADQLYSADAELLGGSDDGTRAAYRAPAPTYDCDTDDEAWLSAEADSLCVGAKDTQDVAQTYETLIALFDMEADASKRSGVLTSGEDSDKGSEQGDAKDSKDNSIESLSGDDSANGESDNANTLRAPTSKKGRGAGMSTSSLCVEGAMAVAASAGVHAAVDFVRAVYERWQRRRSDGGMPLLPALRPGPLLPIAPGDRSGERVRAFSGQRPQLRASRMRKGSSTGALRSQSGADASVADLQKAGTAGTGRAGKRKRPAKATKSARQSKSAAALNELDAYVPLDVDRMDFTDSLVSADNEGMASLLSGDADGSPSEQPLAVAGGNAGAGGGDEGLLLTVPVLDADMFDALDPSSGLQSPALTMCDMLIGDAAAATKATSMVASLSRGSGLPQAPETLLQAGVDMWG